MSSAASPPGRQRPCPICGKPAETRFRPFCSARCADIDLGRWFTERYRIPADGPDEEDGEPETGAGSGR
jgi:endogenous inhibitor of DNA gyrase (YacG/DUF329 family)